MENFIYVSVPAQTLLYIVRTDLTDPNTPVVLRQQTMI